VNFSIQSYRGDRLRQRKLWKPVERKLQEWNRYYTELHQHAYDGPIVDYQDGGTFLIIRQRRRDADPMQHRLTGTSRSIYLFCRGIRSVERILSQFSQLTEDQLMPFLSMMVDKKLMFMEQGRALSLAVRQVGDKWQDSNSEK
jgi:hypothetical protein